MFWNTVYSVYDIGPFDYISYMIQLSLVTSKALLFLIFLNALEVFLFEYGSISSFSFVILSNLICQQFYSPEHTTIPMNIQVIMASYVQMVQSQIRLGYRYKSYSTNLEITWKSNHIELLNSQKDQNLYDLEGRNEFSVTFIDNFSKNTSTNVLEAFGCKT